MSAADDIKDSVAVTLRFHGDVFVGRRKFETIGDAIKFAFEEGVRVATPQEMPDDVFENFYMQYVTASKWPVDMNFHQFASAIWNWHRKQPRLLTFEQLIEANRTRVERWHSLEDWSPLEWAGAMCGETGEAANSAKKYKREETDMPNFDKRLPDTASSNEKLEHYRTQIGIETADAIIYGVLLCLRVKVDLVACIKEAFNRKSEEYGFPERI